MEGFFESPKKSVSACTALGTLIDPNGCLHIGEVTEREDELVIMVGKIKWAEYWAVRPVHLFDL
jgi:hypothetical protein